MAHTLESKLVVMYGIELEQAEALVKAGLGYPHLLKEAKRADIEKVVGKGVAEKIVARYAKRAEAATPVEELVVEQLQPKRGK